MPNFPLAGINCQAIQLRRKTVEQVLTTFLRMPEDVSHRNLTEAGPSLDHGHLDGKMTLEPNNEVSRPKGKGRKLLLKEEKKYQKEREKLQKAAEKAEAAEKKKLEKEKQKWEKGKEQGQYKDPANHTGWKRPLIEEVVATPILVLSKLTINFVKVHYRHCVDEAELAEHVAGLTGSLACQFRNKLTRLFVNANGSLFPRIVLTRTR
ncbi:hypothetical protein HAX54_039638 [Datura stramonium]|uniref:Uncharacterized protein n=1 Tax=Datura stramonium TaxID=4076 RepID=A0ABS8VLK8_DATST|nr:hypothetical protein [Datura stramonium]